MTCLVLDNNDRATVGDNAAFDVAAGSNLLIAVRLKPTAANNSIEGVGKQGHYAVNTNASGFPLVTMNHSVDGTIQAVGSSILSNNVWAWVLGSYRYSTGELGLFVNESRVDLLTGISVSGGIAEAFSDNFTIGSVSGVAFTGKVSDVIVSTDITGFEPSNTSITDPGDYFTADANTVCQYKCDDGLTTTTPTTVDNGEGNSALDLNLGGSPNDPTWDLSDSPFSGGGGGVEVFFQYPYIVRRTKTY